jgi:hypothetical protein
MTINHPLPSGKREGAGGAQAPSFESRLALALDLRTTVVMQRSTKTKGSEAPKSR